MWRQEANTPSARKEGTWEGSMEGVALEMGLKGA